MPFAVVASQWHNKGGFSAASTGMILRREATEDHQYL
jgi:hypothetical protein